MESDERMLEAVSSGVANAPTLRRYAWPEGDDRWATIGYFQKPDIVPPELRDRWARRPTGGGLVLHAGALTWSLVLPPGRAGLKNAREVYRVVHETVRSALAACGVDATLAPATATGRGNVCAVTLGPCDVLVDGRKAAGGAQRRRLGAVLYQGYIDLPALDIQADALWDELVKAVGVIV